MLILPAPTIRATLANQIARSPEKPVSSELKLIALKLFLHDEGKSG